MNTSSIIALSDKRGGLPILTFRDMTAADRETVLPMVTAFYQSDAVEYPVPVEIMERSFQAAVTPEESGLWGVLILADGVAVGYVYLTCCYSCEVGGQCVMIEEVYLQKQYRGQGYGGQIMDWLLEQYPNSRRMRLEVNRRNQQAARMYEHRGFTYLDYDQMVLDKH